ncbi:unnamed protein product [Cylicocyclus nassatus]|uniref:Carbohydrate sulfotransferase n=1 Tax=Cylicocyclus nassatus TaxID=53992 RepID=A0AA36HC91_CYLNA|nr:unnamed protein product [Cylicocyclus nassatus]
MADLYNKTSRPLQRFVNKSLLVPPLVNFKEIFGVSPKFNLATCHIEKIMCTFRAGMFCYLNRRSEFLKKGRSISTERWGNMLCEGGKPLRNTFEETIRSLSKQPIIFNVIRHPIDRFLSGFIDKCIRRKMCFNCFHCPKNLECFITKLHETLVAYYTKSKTLTESEYFCVQHFAPANWYCNLEKSYDKMLFMRYNRCNRNELAEDFVAVLSKAPVPHTQTNYIRKEVLNSRRGKHEEAPLKSEIIMISYFSKAHIIVRSLSAVNLKAVNLDSTLGVNEEERPEDKLLL